MPTSLSAFRPIFFSCVKMQVPVVKEAMKIEVVVESEDKNFGWRNLKTNISEVDEFETKEIWKLWISSKVDEFWGWRNLKAMVIEIEIWS